MIQEQREPVLDPVVDRVRESRRALAESCDFDVDKMADLFERMQAEHPERVTTPTRSVEANGDAHPAVAARP